MSVESSRNHPCYPIITVLQSHSSSLLSLKPKLHEMSDSPGFCYRLDFDWFKNNENEQRLNTSDLTYLHGFQLDMVNSTFLGRSLPNRCSRRMKTLHTRL